MMNVMGYLDNHGGYHDICRVILTTMGDIMIYVGLSLVPWGCSVPHISTLSTMGRLHDTYHDSPHSTEHSPWYSKYPPPTVFKISFQGIENPPWY